MPRIWNHFMFWNPHKYRLSIQNSAQTRKFDVAQASVDKVLSSSSNYILGYRGEKKSKHSDHLELAIPLFKHVHL